ncbi:MAG: tRNA (5-methylaminomethyl-2-thiouridine)(34)-methyltransferase MnmD [Daejeonella sp.]
MNASLSFSITSDGSKTIFNSEVGEHYHSIHGALQESKHVFLESGLKYFLKNASKKAKILEVGFGTGLNFLMSADYAVSHGINLEYTGIEAYPLDINIINDTGYGQFVSTGLWNAFVRNYNAAMPEEKTIYNGCKLHISCTKLLSFETEKVFDIIYYDAFAAVHQPEMWTEASLAHVCKFLSPGGVFVTYAITGNLKRTMKSLGFSVEKAPGAAGKREMLRAVKL